MSKSSLRLFTLLMAVLMMFFSGSSRAKEEKPFPLTNIHRAIASKENGWLNTARPLKAEDFQGRIVLLDFWTFCCINCMHIIPDLGYLEQKFGDKLTVVGIHSAKFRNEQDTGNIRSAILRYGIHHPVVNDFDFGIWQRFGVNSWPTLVLITPEGRIEEVYSGEGHRGELEKKISGLIKKYDGRLVSAPLPIALEETKAPRSVLSFPGKIALFAHTDTVEEPVLFVSDSGHHRIITVDTRGTFGQVIGSGTPGFKDGSFEKAQFQSPQGLVYDSAGETLYVADTGNHAIRRVDLKTHEVSTIAGTGKQGYEREVTDAPTRSTPLSSPWDIAFYPDKEHLAIAMAGLHQLWSLDMAKGTISVLAGSGRESIEDGTLPQNSLSQPSGLSVVGSKLYFVDSETSSLRVFEKGIVTTLIGTGLFDFGFADGKRGAGLLQHPLGLEANEKEVLIADSYNHAIRRFDVATGQLTTISGNGKPGDRDGPLADAQFNEPNDIIRLGDKLLVADTNNQAIRILDLGAGKVSTMELQKEAEAPSVQGPIEHLPNLVRLDNIKVIKNKQVELILHLPKGWKVNKEAPSFLTLFEKGKPVAELHKAELTGKAPALPPLQGAGPYRLQGTIYYCEDREGSVCLIRSFDGSFTPTPKGHDKISIELPAPLP
jgi:thiol-disulfide isomerase/thioredoxin